MNDLAHQATRIYRNRSTVSLEHWGRCSAPESQSSSLGTHDGDDVGDFGKKTCSVSIRIAACFPIEALLTGSELRLVFREFGDLDFEVRNVGSIARHPRTYRIDVVIYRSEKQLVEGFVEFLRGGNPAVEWV